MTPEGEEGLWHHSRRQKPPRGRTGGGAGFHNDFHGVEIAIAGGVGEMVGDNYCHLFFLHFFLYHVFILKVQELYSPSPLHTRRLKSQHHEIITTFPNSTARYEFALGGGVIPPLHSPSLRFIPLGLLLSGLMDFIFFLLMFPLPTPLWLCLAYSICTVGNTLLNAHVTDGRVHGLQ